MKSRSVVLFLAAGLLSIPFFWSTLSNAAGGQTGSRQAAEKKEIYIGLTEDYYRALQSEGDSGNRVYGDRRSDEYLRQIAVSARFMVETNLRLLESQTRIIELLERGRTTGSP